MKLDPTAFQLGGFRLLMVPEQLLLVCESQMIQRVLQVKIVSPHEIWSVYWLADQGHGKWTAAETCRHMPIESILPSSQRHVMRKSQLFLASLGSRCVWAGTAGATGPIAPMGAAGPSPTQTHVTTDSKSSGHGKVLEISCKEPVLLYYSCTHGMARCTQL